VLMNKYLPTPTLCQILATLLIGFLQISPAFANSDLVMKYAAPQITSETTGVIRNKQNIGNGGTCKTQTSLTGNSEWSQFIADVKNGEFFGNVSTLLNGSTPSDYDMLSSMDAASCRLGEVRTPDAAWLFASALIGFVGLSNKRRV